MWVLRLTTTTRATSFEVSSILSPWSLFPFPVLQPPTDFPFLSLALGQLMLFVDGMLGVVAHSETVQWLYTLCASLVSGFTQTYVPFPLWFLLSLSFLFCKVVGVSPRSLGN